MSTARRLPTPPAAPNRRTTTSPTSSQSRAAYASRPTRPRPTATAAAARPAARSAPRRGPSAPLAGSARARARARAAAPRREEAGRRLGPLQACAPESRVAGGIGGGGGGDGLSQLYVREPAGARAQEPRRGGKAVAAPVAAFVAAPVSAPVSAPVAEAALATARADGGRGAAARLESNASSPLSCLCALTAPSAVNRLDARDEPRRGRRALARVRRETDRRVRPRSL